MGWYRIHVRPSTCQWRCLFQCVQNATQGPQILWCTRENYQRNIGRNTHNQILRLGGAVWQRGETFAWQGIEGVDYVGLRECFLTTLLCVQMLLNLCCVLTQFVSIFADNRDWLFPDHAFRADYQSNSSGERANWANICSSQRNIHVRLSPLLSFTSSVVLGLYTNQREEFGCGHGIHYYCPFQHHALPLCLSTHGLPPICSV